MESSGDPPDGSNGFGAIWPLTCGTSPLPIVRNGYVIQLSDTEVSVLCDMGFALPFGQSQETFECQNGTWSLGEGDLICQMDCDEDTQCTPPSTFCHPDFYENYTISFGTVTGCPPGYSVRSHASPMQCVDGTWTPQDDCIPQCDSNCGSYGICSAPNTCLCDNKMVKKTCTENDQEGLANWMVTHCGSLKETVTFNTTTNEFKLGCPASYRFVQGKSGDTMSINCAEGSWMSASPDPGIDELECEPTCEADCLNGGRCNQSGRCVCSSGFFGAACELRRCEPLPIIPNAVVVASTDRSFATVECYQGFHVLGSPAPRLRVPCDDSLWVLPPNLLGGCVSTETALCRNLELPPFVELEDSSPAALRLQCYPNSEILGSPLRAVCVEGDWLAAEGGSNLRTLTLEQWRGLCEPRDACLRNPQFLKHTTFTVAESSVSTGSGVTLGLVTCSPGYVFPTGETSLHVTCSLKTHYKWRVPTAMTSPRLKRDHTPPGTIDDLFTLIPSCEPVCSPPCLNGATCQAPGLCLCTNGFRGSRCEEPCEDYPTGCRAPPPVQDNADIYYNGTLAVMECHAGYELLTGLTHFHLYCEQEKWRPSNIHGGLMREQLPVCQPVCHFPCLNGGHCQSPNSCWCPLQFRGTYCQVPKQHKCPNDPDPVPNALIHVTEAGRLLRCASGYSLKGGLTEAMIWCSDGQWVFPRALYEPQQDDGLTVEMGIMEAPSFLRGLESSFAPCSPVCDPPCINRGVCVAPGQCRCPSPFVGAHCDSTDPALCWGRPPVIQNASIMYSSGSGSLLCEEGYSLMSGVQSVLLSCRAGVWQASVDTTTVTVNEGRDAASSWLDGCRPTCRKPCLNGGVCVSPDSCRCVKGFVGEACETVASKSCLSLVRAKVRADITMSSATSSTTLQCHEGYSLTGNLAEVTLECLDGEWVAKLGDQVVLAAALDCLPVCPGGCTNGGTCRDPGQCECPLGYAGPDCSVRTCEVPPELAANSIQQYDPQSQVLDIQCREGYRLPSGNLTTVLYCDDGAWNTAGGEQKVECLPSCHPPCLNGGRCEGPSTCDCPGGFAGPTCSKRYSLTVDGTRCVFPFYHRGRMHHACTAEYNYTFSSAPNNGNSGPSSFRLPLSCSEEELGGDSLPCDVPWCPTTVDGNRRPMQWGVCAGIVGNVAAQLTEGGERCVFPFSYEGENYRQCTKAAGRHLEWCATEVDERGGATQWDYCQQDYGLESVTITYQGTECRFPFRYEGHWYDDCLSRFSYAGSWCATDVTAAGDLLTKGDCLVHWGHYQDHLTQSQRVCAAPYVMGGVTQWGCQGAEPWCPVTLTLNLAVDKWAFCDPIAEWPGTSVSLPSALDLPEVQVYTVTGERCLQGVGVDVAGCAVDGALQGLPWCPLIRNAVGVITRKGICPPDWHLSFVSSWLRSFVDAGPKEPLVRHTTQGVQCVLPFRYRGRTHLDCAPHRHQPEDDSLPRSWCAASVKRDLEVETWGFCKENIYSVPYGGPKVLSVVQNIVTQQQKHCVFPFHYDGSVYFSCVPDNSTLNSQGWCAISVTGNGGVGLRGDCPLLASQLTDLSQVIQECKDEGQTLIFPAGPGMNNFPSPSQPLGRYGPRCVVPFVYRSATYWDCTEAGDAVARWCAVEVDEQRRVVKKERCLPGWYLKAADLIKKVAWERDWILDMRGAVLRVGNLHPALDTDWQRVDTSSGQTCVFPFLLPGSSAPQHRCVCPPSGCGESGPVCATRVDKVGNMLQSEPCRGLLIRKENFFDQLMSH